MEECKVLLEWYQWGSKGSSMIHGVKFLYISVGLVHGHWYCYGKVPLLDWCEFW